MNIKCFLIIFSVLIQYVEMKSECSEQFRCFSEFIKDFIQNGLKYDIVVKETREDNDFNNPLLTVEIPSRKLMTAIKQAMNILDLYIEGHIEMDKFDSQKLTEVVTINKIDNILSQEITNFKTFVKDGELRNITRDKDQIYNNTDSQVPSKSVKVNKVVIDEFDDYYEFQSDNTTDYPIIDYIDLYKDTTNDPVEFISTEMPNIEKLSNTEPATDVSKEESSSYLNMQQQCYFNGSRNSLTQSVFPWITALFVKNKTSERFDYYCDGALLSDKIILTAAKCVSRNGTALKANDMIALLEKRSLVTMGDKEKAIRINNIRLHDNFTGENEDGNDLAILLIDEPDASDEMIMVACLSENSTEDYLEDSAEMATTGWAVSGKLTAIQFDKEKSKLCQNDASDGTFCAIYNYDVITCPSFGGIFVTRDEDNIWRLRGIRTGDPSDKGICFNTGVFYTDLQRHSDWIQKYI